MAKKITQKTLKNLILDVLTEATEDEARDVAQGIKDNGGSKRDAIVAIRSIDDSDEPSMQTAARIAKEIFSDNSIKSSDETTNMDQNWTQYDIEEPSEKEPQQLSPEDGGIDLQNYDDGYVAGYDLISDDGNAKPIYLNQKAAQKLYDLDPEQIYLKFTKVVSQKISESYIKKLNEKKMFDFPFVTAPHNIYKIEPKPNFLNLKTKMRQIDALNDNDSKYESEDMSNLEIFTADLPYDQKKLFIDTFRVLKRFNTISSDSEYHSKPTLDGADKDSFYRISLGEIENVSNLNVSQINASMALKKSLIISSQNRSFFESQFEEKLFVELVKKMNKRELIKLFSNNMEFQIGSPGFPEIKSVKPLMTNDKMWSSVISVTPTMPQESLDKIFLTNYMKLSKIDDSLIESKICAGWTPQLTFDKGSQEYKKQEGFLTIFISNYDSSQLNKLYFLEMPFFITMFDNILSNEVLPDGLVKSMLDYIRDPTNVDQTGPSLELDESKKRKVISESRNKQSFLNAYLNSNWAKQNDKPASMLTQAERILASKEDVSNLGTSPTDQFPSSGLGTDDLRIDRGTTSVDATGDFITNMNVASGAEFKIISSAVQNQTKLDPELVKLFSGTFSNLSNIERLELITMFAKHITENSTGSGGPTDFEKYVSKYGLSGFDLYNLGRICTLMFDASKKISGGNVGAMFEGLLTYLFVAPGTGTQTVLSKQGPVDNVFATFSSPGQKNYIYSSAKVYTSLAAITQNGPRMKAVLDTGANIFYFIFKKSISSLADSKPGLAAEYDEIKVVITKCYKDGTNYKFVHLDSAGNETGTSGSISTTGSTKVCAPTPTGDAVAFTIPVVKEDASKKSMFEDAFQEAVSSMNSAVGEVVKSLTVHFDSIESYKKDAQRISTEDLNPTQVFPELFMLSMKLAEINSTALESFGIDQGGVASSKIFSTSKSTKLEKGKKLEESSPSTTLVELANLIAESFKK